MKITLAGITFPSKKAAHTAIRASLTPETFNPENPLYMALLMRHPHYEEKWGCGVLRFELEWRDLSKTFEPLIVRKDGSTVDFSWVRCLSGTWMSHKDKLRQAMRVAIEPQIRAHIAKDHPESCPLCAKYITHAHVDHIIPFEELAQKFLEDKTLVPTHFDDCPDTHRAKFRESDLEWFTIPWIAFHAVNARLRTICATCNLKRG
jgi:hypothetical protein